ncbi:response regulator receiver domain-containing protein [Acidovorax sp. 69]|uniref:response regulator n=1 Tax=Acidovorax sp. 69 TaxID=2035202 RepID=UPI000C231F00|nr:response regulator [Acidovorax sp. 69]PJI99576.1 response regulator receiver domain-containing protein [Acidovorax sp. 69]
MTALLPRILLIEPQFVLRRTMVMVARDLGMVDFHEASSVGRARALLAADAYEGMVLDLQEGPQAMELLSDLRQGRFATPSDVRVVVLAADDGKSLATERLQDLGVACVLGKPVRISELLDAIVGVQEQVSPAS